MLGWRDSALARKNWRGRDITAAMGSVLSRPWGIAQQLVLFCLCYILGALLVWPAEFINLAGIYLLKMCVVAGWSLVLALPVACIYSPKRPLSFAINLVRSRGTRLAIIVSIFLLSLAAYTTYKINIPSIIPFYGDKAMADLSELVLGWPEWRIAHAIDSEFLASTVALFYSRLWFLQWFGMVFFVGLAGSKPLHLRYLLALALTTFVAGTLLATLFSSAGPIFYDRFHGTTRYAELIQTLKQYPANNHILLYSDYLLSNYLQGAAALGSGISAMPSMHVAIATLNAFYLGEINRWLGIAGWLFAGIILFGSVYTGWHYAVDGYVSILLVASIWQRTGTIFNPAEAAEAPIRSASPTAS